MLIKYSTVLVRLVEVLPFEFVSFDRVAKVFHHFLVVSTWPLRLFAWAIFFCGVIWSFSLSMFWHIFLPTTPLTRQKLNWSVSKLMMWKKNSTAQTMCLKNVGFVRLNPPRISVPYVRFKCWVIVKFVVCSIERAINFAVGTNDTHVKIPANQLNPYLD